MGRLNDLHFPSPAEAAVVGWREEGRREGRGGEGGEGEEDDERGGRNEKLPPPH